MFCHCNVLFEDKLPSVTGFLITISSRYIIFSVGKYQNRFTWLKDQRFLHDLERDSVDTDLLEEELRCLSEQEELT